MAAVVASIAGILAGCSLPLQSSSGGGRSFVTRDPGDERELGGGGGGAGRGGSGQSTAVWTQCQARQAATLGITATFAEALSVKPDALKVVATQARPDLEPILVAPLVLAPAPAPAAVTILKKSPGPLSDGGEDDEEHASPKPDRAACRVHFDLSKLTEHEITPYAEVYNGVHPRLFDFGKGLPAPFTHFVDPRAKPLPEWQDPEDEDDEDVRLTRYGRRRAHSLRAVPRHLWIMVCVACFLVRAFGTAAVLEFLPDVLEGWQSMKLE